MKKIDPIIIGIIVIVLLMVGGVILAYIVSPKEEAKKYSVNDENRPVLEISQKEFNFGQMKLDDTKTQKVSIKNIGQSPLLLSDFATSCNCTFVQAVINGKESPLFSMHSRPDWQGVLQPDETGILKLIYEPKLMPVKGSVTRQIVFKTNDPAQPLITLKFTANVE